MYKSVYSSSYSEVMEAEVWHCVARRVDTLVARSTTGIRSRRPVLL
jgi:hypothetical protein